MTRPTLRALAHERGCDGAGVWREVEPDWDACAWDDYGDPVITLRAPTRRAAEAGLRAALESLPVRKVKP